MRFEELELSEPLLRAVREEGYEVATPIQVAAIPSLLAGRDLVGCARRVREKRPRLRCRRYNGY